MKPYYDHNGITIYNADCREVLPELEPVDLVLCDPPYGIGESSKKHESRGKLCTAGGYGQSNWDDNPIDDDIICLMFDVSKRLIMFGGNYYAMPPTSCLLIWDKDNTGGYADAEIAWTNLPQAVRLKKYRWNGMLQQAGRKHEKRLHPTMKPLEVMSWCIEQADKHGDNNTILDPFMGSGTTLVAAKQLGRKAIGIELEEKSCEIAVKRLQQEYLAL